MKSNEQLPRFACTSPTGGFGGDGFDGGAELFAMELEVGQVFRSFLSAMSAMYTGIWQIDSLVVVYVGRRVFDIYNVVTRHGGVMWCVFCKSRGLRIQACHSQCCHT